ncbi:hypothetical protein [Pedobacter miscanthi]|uniref:hypothetical protein n=1 Tax=Pedobacter miscanthi TaxID=2259170 RepID=UPI00292DBC5F|nr:hypothetical protein [Pedobacter miscanthi]
MSALCKMYVSSQLGLSIISPFYVIRPNKFFGAYYSSHTTDFERKIFSWWFLFLFGSKKKEPIGGGEPRKDCADG